MAMSLRENITAVIETCFSETKDEIQEVAINKILELIRNDKADRKTENSLEKPNNSTTEDCSDIEEWYTFRDEQEYNARHGKE